MTDLLPVEPETPELPSQLHGDALWIALAVLIDGEGCIRIAREKPGCKTGTLLRYSPDIRVINTNIAWMHAWCKRVGVGTVSKPIQTQPQYKPRVQWSIVRKADVKMVLDHVTPYLFCKRRQAELCLEFFDKYRPVYGRVANPVGMTGYTRRRPTDEDLAWRESMFQESKRLNQKGVALSL